MIYPTTHWKLFHHWRSVRTWSLVGIFVLASGSSLPAGDTNPIVGRFLPETESLIGSKLGSMQLKNDSALSSLALGLVENSTNTISLAFGADLLRIEDEPELDLSQRALGWSNAVMRLRFSEKQKAGLAPWLLVNALAQQGVTALDQGDFKVARLTVAKARAIGPITRVTDDIRDETTLIDAKKQIAIGRVHEAFGDPDAAKDYEYALAIIRDSKVFFLDPTVEALTRLGCLYCARGKPRNSTILLKEAIRQVKLAEAEGSPPTPRGLVSHARIFDLIAKRAMAFNRPEEAREAFANALSVRERIYGTNHFETGINYADLGSLALDGGDFAAALDYDRKALRVLELPQNHAVPGLVRVREQLCYVLLSMGKTNEALTNAREFERISEDLWSAVVSATSGEQRIIWQQNLNTALSLAATFADADPSLIALTSLRLKGLIVESISGDWGAFKWAGFPGVGRVADLYNLTTTQSFQDYEAELVATKHLREAHPSALRATLKEVRQALAPDVVLVEFVSYRHYLGYKNRWDDRYGAILWTAKDEPRWVTLGRCDEINSKITEYTSGLRTDPRDLTADTIQRWKRAQDHIVKNVWLPVEQALHRKPKTVILCPDDHLAEISFASLWTKAHFLGEDFDIRYVSSARDLLGASRKPKTNENIVIFADPAFDRPPQPPDPNGFHQWWISPYVVKCAANLQFKPLPATLDEARLLSDVARQNGFAQVAMFTNVLASKAKLRAVQHPYVLHLATHGNWLSCGFSGRWTNGVPERLAVRDRSEVGMFNSWLLLAGANTTLSGWQVNKIPEPGDDGILTAGDVATLDLQGTWLAGLVACDSGAGIVTSGDGVFGLRRAFALAGAQNLMLALWPVDDKVAPKLVAEFYNEALKPQRDAPGALLQVQRKYLRQVNDTAGLLEAVRSAGPFVLNSVKQ